MNAILSIFLNLIRFERGGGVKNNVVRFDRILSTITFYNTLVQFIIVLCWVSGLVRGKNVFITHHNHDFISNFKIIKLKYNKISIC